MQTFLEANAKGYWDTDEENLQKLRDVYQDPLSMSDMYRNVTCRPIGGGFGLTTRARHGEPARHYDASCKELGACRSARTKLRAWTSLPKIAAGMVRCHPVSS